MPDQEQAPASEAVSFGAAIRTVATELAHERGLPATYGVEVGKVRPGSAADAAGIRTGDIIIAVGPYTIHRADQLRQAVGGRQPGGTMTLTVWRDRGRLEVEVRF